MKNAFIRTSNKKAGGRADTMDFARPIDCPITPFLPLDVEEEPPAVSERGKEGSGGVVIAI